jgi:hypothetical protein
MSAGREKPSFIIYCFLFHITIIFVTEIHNRASHEQ